MLPYKSSSHSAKCVRCAPKGATITLSPVGLSPPERKRTQPFYTTRGGAAPPLKIAAKPPPQPSGQRPVKLKNPPAAGRSILRTCPSESFEYALRSPISFSPLTRTKCYCILLTYRGPKGRNYIFLTKMSDDEWFTSGFFFWTRGPGNISGPFLLSRKSRHSLRPFC